MGIFDNASSVVIGNKEVQSIVRVSDGAVLYQKAASHSYALAFSSASYQTDSCGDVTVYVTLTDNGVPVSGETVNFSDATSVYTGITNNLGVASVSLNYHSNGTVTASYSNASATASIVSNYSPSYTGVMSYALSEYTINIQTEDTDLICFLVSTLEDLSHLNGHTVEDIQSFPIGYNFGEYDENTETFMNDLIAELSEQDYYSAYYFYSDEGWNGEYDLLQLLEEQYPDDYHNDNNLLILFTMNSDYIFNKFVYSASDSTHLTATLN